MVGSAGAREEVRPMKISAYRGDEETWRIERLEEVAKRPLPPNVIALRDHKGILSVTWSSLPTIEDLTAVVQAWGYQNEWLIEHFLNDEPLTEVTGHSPWETAA
jgi:hypothetical protein